jgi:hypothetical protein
MGKGKYLIFVIVINCIVANLTKIIDLSYFDCLLVINTFVFFLFVKANINKSNLNHKIKRLYITNYVIAGIITIQCVLLALDFKLNENIMICSIFLLRICNWLAYTITKLKIKNKKFNILLFINYYFFWIIDTFLVAYILKQEYFKLKLRNQEFL